MSTARYSVSGAGASSDSAIGAGGTPPTSSATELWTGAGTPQTKTIDTD